MRSCKLLLVAITATAVFGALTATASPRTFSTSSQTLRAQFRELRIEGAFGQTVCQITLEGSFHSRSIAKVAGALIGYITAAKLGPCAVGSATILRETLPWHTRYVWFTGVLPDIATMRTQVVNPGLMIRTNVAETCLVESSEVGPMIVTFNLGVGNPITTAYIEGIGIPTSCFFSARVSSDFGPVTVLNSSTTRITVRLI